ncbi:MAG: WYL domain-containing protein [Myxococcota bacterium]
MVRSAIATGRRLRFGYVDRSEQRSERVVRPLAVYYWGGKWTVAAWCEAREDYRNFRPDRMEEPALGEPYPADDPPISVAAFVARQVQRDRERGFAH